LYYGRYDNLCSRLMARRGSLSPHQLQKQGTEVIRRLYEAQDKLVPRFRNSRFIDGIN